MGSPEFSPRPRYVEEFLVADGITRAGKFLLGNVVSGIERVEFLQAAPLLTQLPYLHRLGKIGTETATALLRTDIASRVHDRILGRNLNGRAADLSCIHRTPDHGLYLARAASRDDRALIRSFLAEKRLPLFIAHDALAHASFFFEVFPRAKLLHILRDPVALVESWRKRGWGKRFGADPTSMDHAFKSPRGPIPWYAVGWKKNYHSMGELERIVHSLAAAIRLARREYEALPARLKARVAFVTFEELTEDPRPAVARLGAFIGRPPSRLMKGTLKRERLPRAVEDDRREALLRRFSKALPPGGKTLLETLARDYDHFWRPLASSRWRGA